MQNLTIQITTIILTQKIEPTSMYKVESKSRTIPPTGIAREKLRIIWEFKVEGKDLLWVERVGSIFGGFVAVNPTTYSN